MSEITRGNIEFDVLPRHLRAAAQIAEAESVARTFRIRGEAFNPTEEGLTPQQRIARTALRTAFYDLTEVADLDIEAGKTAVEWLTEQTNDIPSATLGRIEMNGEWDAADRYERDLIPILSTLYDKGYRNFNVIERTNPDAQIRVTVPAGLTAENGYVALRRKRRFISATPPVDRLDLPTISVHKASMFALDINKLAEINDIAAHEVRLIVARTMFLAIDWKALGTPPPDDYTTGDDVAEAVFMQHAQRMMVENQQWQTREPVNEGQVDDRFLLALEGVHALARAHRQYGFTEEEIQHRLGMPLGTHLHQPESLQFVEEALHRRSSLLTPALTTYYVRT